MFAASCAMAQEAGNVMYADMANKAYEGNSVYNSHNYNQSHKTSGGNFNNYLPNDSVYTFGAKVMINVQPDSYMAVFGVSQEAITVSECTKLINTRIDNFKAGLKALGIKDDDLFVDMIVQTRIYDYKISGKTATETKQGFEIKKNVIIKFTDHSLVEKMMLSAAEQEIFDIVKIDYILNDPEKVQNQLRAAAMEIVGNKKKFVLDNSSLVLSDKGLIQYESFNTIYPDKAYKQYVAAETGNVSSSYYNSNTWIKEQRKSKTFYFDSQNPATFDRVINPVTVKVPVQMSLDVMYKFYIGKPEKKMRK
jgi:uncharacterized protein YggE